MKKPVVPLPGSPCDLVLDDRFYSQLLYPDVCDLGFAGEARLLLEAATPPLVDAAVARVHASAPDGHVVHIHARQASGPHVADPRAASRRLGLPIVGTAWWHRPFADDVDYLVCATLGDPVP